MDAALGHNGEIKWGAVNLLITNHQKAIKVKNIVITVFDKSGRGRKQCPNCELYVGSSRLACVCGHQFIPKKVEKSNSGHRCKKPCPKCHNYIGPNSLSCAHCGYQFTSPTLVRALHNVTQCQNALAMSDVVYSMAKDMRSICRKYGLNAEAQKDHPIFQLYLHKLFLLAGYKEQAKGLFKKVA